jgi:hypothetical protein
MRTIEEIKADMKKAMLNKEWFSELKDELLNAITSGIPLDELEKTCNAMREGRCYTIPQDYRDADEFYHVVKCPEWCGEDCQCEGKRGDGCPYDADGDCTFKPYVRRVSRSSVYHAMYILEGLSITIESAKAALQKEDKA